MSKIDTLIKLAGKFKSDLRQQYKDSMGYPDAGEIARRKDMGAKSPREKINEAFNYIESSKSPDQARNRAQEMFGDFDVDGAVYKVSSNKYKSLLGERNSESNTFLLN